MVIDKLKHFVWLVAVKNDESIMEIIWWFLKKIYKQNTHERSIIFGHLSKLIEIQEILGLFYILQCCWQWSKFENKLNVHQYINE